MLTVRNQELLLLPAHPQANGQVKVMNRSLLKIIKTWFKESKGIYPEELPSVLWAYRTTAKTHTRETPFRFAYGDEAVIPTKVKLTSYKVGNHDERKSVEAMRLQLDLMDEVRAAAKQRLDDTKTSWPNTTTSKLDTETSRSETSS